MKKLLIFSIILFMLFSSTIVLAIDSEPDIIDSDLLLSEKNSYVLDKEVSGNVFNVSNDFELSSSSIVNGDLFLVSKNVLLKSDVSYSEDTISKDNEKSIDKINSSSSINGNVYAVCTDFTMNPGVEITGDLYIVAKNINIEKSSIIHGNIFAVSETFTLNGRVENSVYTYSQSFTTSYYGTIYKDLNLSADKATLNSVVRRDVNINARTISTDKDFLVYGDLNVDANNFGFSGEINGNAIIRSKKLDFIDKKDEMSIKCLIKGDLNYSSQEEMQNIDSYVDGAIVHSEYKEVQKNNSTFSFKSFILELLTFVLYTFAIAWIFTLLNKAYLNKKPTINVGNIFSSLGVGLLAIVLVIVLSMLLFIINVGVTLSFALIFAYIFLLIVSTPLFVLDIAIILKEKINLYLGILTISVILFMIYQVPFIGGFVSFLFTTIGSGRIILILITNSKKKSTK